jgi:hypothetical protein
MLQIAPARPDAARAVPGDLICDAMIGPVDPDGRMLRSWLTEADKCMQPAKMITQFRCENNHSGSNFRCAPHGQDGDTQICGDCALLGQRVRAVVRIIEHL